MLSTRKLRPILLTLGVAAAAGDANAVPFLPPYSTIINQPLVIPTDGVLAIGTIDVNQGRITTTEGALSSVLDPGQAEVPGAAAHLNVELGAGAGSGTQLISLWKPSAPFQVGRHTAFGVSDSGDPFQTNAFEVVEDASVAGPQLTLLTQEVVALRLPATELPCGTTFGISAQTIELKITTEYSLQPSVNVQYAVAASDARLSQYFARATQPGVSGNYAPLPLIEGMWTFSSAYKEPQAEYCVVASLLSLATGATVDLEPACIADDDTDWSAIVPATAAEIDAQLRACSEPPAAYQARYCAVLRAAGTTREGCEVYSTAELDAALTAPLPSPSSGGGALPAPSVIPSAIPTDVTSTSVPPVASTPPASASATSGRPATSASTAASSRPAATASGVPPAGDPPVNGVSTDGGGGCSVGKPASAFAWQGATGWLLLGCCVRRGRRRNSPGSLRVRG
jgi:hypothetical protein